MDDISVPAEAEPTSTPEVDEPIASTPAEGGSVEGGAADISPADPAPAKSPVDLSVLEKIEAELAAVERALVKIDEGVYEGFDGIEDISAPSAAG